MFDRRFGIWCFHSISYFCHNEYHQQSNMKCTIQQQRLGTKDWRIGWIYHYWRLIPCLMSIWFRMSFSYHSWVLNTFCVGGGRCRMWKRNFKLWRKCFNKLKLKIVQLIHFYLFFYYQCFILTTKKKTRLKQHRLMSWICRQLNTRILDKLKKNLS